MRTIQLGAAYGLNNEKVMFNKLLVLNLFCIVFGKVYSQSNRADLEVVYQFRMQTDSTDINTVVTEPMVLLANAERSIYYPFNYEQNLNMIRKELNSNSSDIVIDLSQMPAAKAKHYVSRNKESVTILNSISRIMLAFKAEDIAWKLNEQSETKTILGNVCYKASAVVNNRKYWAWYTKDVPINDGPYKFKGLPGLILQVSDENNWIRFDAISMVKSNKNIFEKEGIPITKEQYIKKRKEYLEDPSQGRINTPDYRNFIEKMKGKSNVFLEN